MHWQIIWNRTDRNCNFFFFIKKISFLFPLLSLTARSLDSLPLLYSLSLSSFLLSLSLYFSLPLSLSLSSLPNYHRSLSCSGFFFFFFGDLMDGFDSEWVQMIIGGFRQWMDSKGDGWVQAFKWWWVGSNGRIGDEWVQMSGLGYRWVQMSKFNGEWVLIDALGGGWVGLAALGLCFFVLFF